jgi:hypothetical protein
VLLPLAVQLSDVKFAEFARSETGTTQGLHLDRPQRLMSRVADRVGIPVIDLLPAFREWTAGGGGALYLERDGHWNGNGHRLAADIVARELAYRGLVP